MFGAVSSGMHHHTSAPTSDLTVLDDAALDAVTGG